MAEVMAEKLIIGVKKKTNPSLFDKTIYKDANKNKDLWDAIGLTLRFCGKCFDIQPSWSAQCKHCASVSRTWSVIREDAYSDTVIVIRFRMDGPYSRD